MDMIYSIVTAALVEGVGVSEEWFAAKFLDDANDDSSIVRTYVSHVAQLTEVNLQCHILVLEIYLFDTCFLYHALQFLKQIASLAGTQVGEIYF